MLYHPGDMVYYRKYTGKVKWVYWNKSYMVTLYNYRGFHEMEKQIDERELYPMEQLAFV